MKGAEPMLSIRQIFGFRSDSHLLTCGGTQNFLDFVDARSTASISQCFMTKHCKKIEERDTLFFIILCNKKIKYYTALFL